MTRIRFFVCLLPCFFWSLSPGSIPGEDALYSESAEESSGNAGMVFYPRGQTAADEGARATLPIFPPSPVPFFFTLLGLGLLLGGLAAVTWWMLRRGSGGNGRGRSSGRLEIMETRFLGNRQYLMVTGYGENRVLLGISPGRIDFLCPLNHFSEVLTEEEEAGATAEHPSSDEIGVPESGVGFPGYRVSGRN